MDVHGKINEFEASGPEAVQGHPSQGTGPSARLNQDLSAGANTAVALAGSDRSYLARASSVPRCSRGASQKPDRRLSIQPLAEYSSVGLRSGFVKRQSLMRRHCPICRPNWHKVPELLTVERTQPVPVCLTISEGPRWPAGVQMLPLPHYLTLAAQRGGQADTETVTAERNSQERIAST